jgi:hypothetical protein
MDPSPIVGTIVVTHETPRGILAEIDGQPQRFANRTALFRAAAELLDARLRDQQEKGP